MDAGDAARAREDGGDERADIGFELAVLLGSGKMLASVYLKCSGSDVYVARTALVLLHPVVCVAQPCLR